ncbi:ATP-dependent helicase [Enemella sp. A6]|uniref:ATP-dependent helicase n=1 Tax=Enemella sp. A6 TaxID=3440152 RepID=UPI003EB708AA
MSVLQRFTAPTREWFDTSFSAPTAAQAGAWQAISSGEHTLVVAPTGSGKTLAAFLWAIDRLAADEEREDAGCRVLYISPLKALAVDVERNLRAPLVGIGHAAARLGATPPQISVAVRSGDTPAAERRRFAQHPDDVLITTPESLYLLLTSQAREALRTVETVIVDEIHAVAGTKRGAHLALSLERLDHLLERPAQRIGLSATVRPVEEVARFLAGGRPVSVVNPGSTKSWDLSVEVPVDDLAAIGQPGQPESLLGPAAGEPRRSSIWPHVEERIVDLIEQHRSTLVFANSRRLAETLTTRLNEIADERRGVESAGELSGIGGAPHSTNLSTATAYSRPHSGDLARAHHGSVSHDQRAVIEEDLKAGRLPAVVATSSLELGIDMGAVDLVVQVEAPPSVASGLQRVGRAGHQVGAVSRGVFFPKYRGDLVPCAVTTERMLAGAIEHLSVGRNPLDVLAQQIVAAVAMDDWTVPELEAMVRRAAPFTGLTRPVLESVLDMLSGRYPSEAFAELRPRLTWHRGTDTLVARRGAQRLAVTSGGTIPDRGLFGVFVAGDGPGRRVGELDEEMVYESRVGDVITLGTSTWRVLEITHDQVLVAPAPGEPGRLPFWKGDTIGRPAELGAAVGAFVREVAALSPEQAHARLNTLDERAVDNLVGYLAEQREAISALPDDRTIVVERFRDELGDWRVVIHTPWGAPVHAPWSLAIGAALRERFGVEVSAMYADDGIVLRLPDTGDPWAEDDPKSAAPDIADLIIFDPEEITNLVTEQVGGSALFAARFRECAGRALLLPNRRPGQRQALWQQRQRAGQLLEVAAQFPDFPIVLEAVRECLQDVFDLPGLAELMARVRSRDVHVVEATTPRPSPFASSLLFGYVAQFIYEGDAPLAEKRAAALTVDPDLLGELLGTGAGPSLRDLLDPEAIERTEAELQHLTETRKARDADDLTDLLRVLGPLTAEQLAERCREPDAVPRWLTELVDAARVFPAHQVGGQRTYAAIEDAGRLRDGLGVALPLGVPAVFTEPVDDPLGELIARFARTHGPFTATELAGTLGLGVAVVSDHLARLVSEGRLLTGEFRPGASGTEFCDPQVLRTIRRRTVAALRAEIEPVPQADYARFLTGWQGLGRGRGVDGVLQAVEQLAGAVLPASAVESVVLPARVPDYRPAMLDELCAAGEVGWRGHGALAGNDGWISLYPAALAGFSHTAPHPSGADNPTRAALLELLADGGGYFFSTLSTAGPGAAEELWQLVWDGLVTNDTLAPLRQRLAGGRTTHKARVPAARGRSRHRARIAGNLPTPGPPGRWSLTPTMELDATQEALLTADILLDRYGVLTRGSVVAEDIPGGFARVYQVLSAAEAAGKVRRGYFVEGLGAAQFADTGAIDRLRTGTDQPVLIVAATDPANPYGAALGWPETPAHRPARKAGALVLLADGALIGYLERGGRTMLTWPATDDQITEAAAQLVALVRSGRMSGLSIDRIDGADIHTAEHPWVAAMLAAGFHHLPRGIRIRR